MVPQSIQCTMLSTDMRVGLKQTGKRQIGLKVSKTSPDSSQVDSCRCKRDFRHFDFLGVRISLSR
jgi:hypothetical protein